MKNRLSKFSKVLLIAFVYCFMVSILAHSQGSKIDSTLITLDSIPRSFEIIDIELIPYSNQELELNPELFKGLIDSAVVISAEDPILQEWHYAPWYNGSFKTEKGVYNFILYLGGLGILETPEDLRGAFMLNVKTLYE
jgi:hypothetical protein